VYCFPVYDLGLFILFDVLLPTHLTFCPFIWILPVLFAACLDPVPVPSLHFCLACDTAVAGDLPLPVVLRLSTIKLHMDPMASDSSLQALKMRHFFANVVGLNISSDSVQHLVKGVLSVKV